MSDDIGAEAQAEANKFETEVAARVAAARRIANLTQRAVAGSVGLSFQQVHKYESGQSRMTVGMLHLMSKALDVPLSVFLAPVEGVGNLQDLFGDPLLMPLLRAFRATRSAAVRAGIVDLLQAVVAAQGDVQ